MSSSDVVTLVPTATELDYVVAHHRPGIALVAEAHRLVVGVDLRGLGHDGGRVMVDALARQRERNPRPQCVVAINVVGEHAPRPDAHERMLGRQFADHCSVFVCVAEGTSVRAQWVRGVVGSIGRFLARRTPMFITRTVEESAVIAARELDLEAARVAALLHELRTRAAG